MLRVAAAARGARVGVRALRNPRAVPRRGGGHHDHHHGPEGFLEPGHIQPPHYRLPLPRRKLHEEHELIWNDGVAPETCLDFDAPHIGKWTGLAWFLGGFAFFYVNYKLVEFLRPVGVKKTAAREIPASSRVAEGLYEEEADAHGLELVRRAQNGGFPHFGEPAMAGVILFSGDTPIFEMYEGSAESARNCQLLAHAALDAVETREKKAPACYLKVVDRLSEQLVSAYLGFGLKIIVVHTDAANDEGVAAFCTEAHELYCKMLRNPLYAPGSKIDSVEFDRLLRVSGERWLRARFDA